MARLPFGYASGFGHAQVVPLNILIETIQVLVIYPLFVQSTRHLIRLRTLEPFIMRIHHVAQSGGGVVRRPTSQSAGLGCRACSLFMK